MGKEDNLSFCRLIDINKYTSQFVTNKKTRKVIKKSIINTIIRRKSYIFVAELAKKAKSRQIENMSVNKYIYVYNKKKII